MERDDDRIVAPTESTRWQRILGRDLDRGCECVGRVAHRHSGGCCGTLDGDPAWRRTVLQCRSVGPFDPSVECSRTIALRVCRAPMLDSPALVRVKMIKQPTGTVASVHLWELIVGERLKRGDLAARAAGPEPAHDWSLLSRSSA